ncbi:hypothetical protein FJT64_020876 [Amphibalanus amphitrite]|uniref:Uncharacterized protein n=1 Tax=Amphibalanus amphitrite TaxID=1232801 RepID=A0A6A4WK87_AMPAM|nr:hypothetical protein FJT64_020876 [Amphibalanus amphitrite]
MGDMAGSSLTLSSKSHHRLANMIRKPFPFHRRPSPASSPTGAGPTGSPSPPVSSDALDDSLASLESGEERDGAPRSPAAAADTAEDSVTASQPSEGYQTVRTLLYQSETEGICGSLLSYLRSKQHGSSVFDVH